MQTGIPYTQLKGTVYAKDFERLKLYVREFGPFGLRRLDDLFALLTHSVYQSQCSKSVGDLENYKLVYVVREAEGEDMDPDELDRRYEQMLDTIQRLTIQSGGEVVEGPIETISLEDLNLYKINHGNNSTACSKRPGQHGPICGRDGFRDSTGGEPWGDSGTCFKEGG